jgi:hypothetical protein
MSDAALYEARGLHIAYQRGRRPPVRAVDGVDLTWRRPCCPVAFDRCPVEDPRLPAEAERSAACWLAID